MAIRQGSTRDYTWRTSARSESSSSTTRTRPRGAICGIIDLHNAVEQYTMRPDASQLRDRAVARVTPHGIDEPRGGRSSAGPVHPARRSSYWLLSYCSIQSTPNLSVNDVNHPNGICSSGMKTVPPAESFSESCSISALLSHTRHTE